MKVLFFARLRELNGEHSVEIEDSTLPGTVGELLELLRETAPPELAEALGDENVFCAVNQKVVDAAFAISPGDEIAFFPPMTGG